MGEKTNVERTSNTITAILFVSVFLAVMLLAIVLVIDALSNAQTTANGITLTFVTTSNEIGFANSSGYTLANAGALNFTLPTLILAYNRTNATPILVPLTNFTLSSSGVLKNSSASAKVFNNLSVTYSYYYDTTSTNSYNTVLKTGIRDNVAGMVSNFFALAPTIGTILAVVVLIAVIVILVLHVRRMKQPESENYGGYTG